MPLKRAADTAGQKPAGAAQGEGWRGPGEEAEKNMDEKRKAPAFDGVKETGRYIPPAGEDDSPRERRRRRDAVRSARRQLVGSAALLLTALAVVLAAILIFQSVRPGGMTGRTLLHYDGLTYEQVEETEEMAALGLTLPLTDEDCGTRLAVLTDGEWQGTTLYRLEACDTRALLAAEKEGEIALYRFCYFADGADHTGGEVLEVVTDGTTLTGVDSYGSTGGWSRLLRSGEELAQFEAAFSALRPAGDADSLREQMEQTSWDAMLTLRCGNGLTFHLSVYSELRAAAGFRTVYPLSEDFLALICE